jgi:hypothetical protein
VQQKRKIGVVIVFVAVIVVSLFVVALLNQVFLFSENVNVEQIRTDPNIGSYSTSITNDDGEVLANVYFRIDHNLPNQMDHRMIFSISPYNRAEVDSLILTFSAGTKNIQIYKEASTSVFQGAQIYQKNNEIILTLPDIGDYGQSTIRLDFILERYSAENLSVIADLSMHQEASLQLTSQKAQVYINADIPIVANE